MTDAMSGQNSMSNARPSQSRLAGRSASENVGRKRKRRQHVTNINRKASTCNMFTVEPDIYKGVPNYSGLVKLPVRRGSSDHFKPSLPTPGDVRSMFGVANICEQPEYSVSPTLMKDPDWQELVEDQSAATRADEIAQWEEQINYTNTDQSLDEVLAQIALFNEHINRSRTLEERLDEGAFEEKQINQMTWCSSPGDGVEETSFKEEKINSTKEHQFLEERENEITCKNRNIGYQNKPKQINDRKAVWEGQNNPERLSKIEKTADILWADQIFPYNQIEKIHGMPVGIENTAIKEDKVSIQKSELASPKVKLNQTKHIESRSKKSDKVFRIKQSNHSEDPIPIQPFCKKRSRKISEDRCPVQKLENVMPHKKQCSNIIENQCSVESSDGLAGKNKCNHMGKSKYPVVGNHKYNWNTVAELLDYHIKSGSSDCLYVKKVILAALSHISKTASLEDQTMLQEMRDKISATDLVNEIIGSYVEMRDKLIFREQNKSTVRYSEDDLKHCVRKAMPTISQHNQVQSGQYLTPTSLAIDLSSDGKEDNMSSTWEDGSFDEKVREAFHLIRRIDGLLQSTETERGTSRANRLKGSRQLAKHKKCLPNTSKLFLKGNNEVCGKVKQENANRSRTIINTLSKSNRNKKMKCDDNGVNATNVLYMLQDTDVEKERMKCDDNATNVLHMLEDTDVEKARMKCDDNATNVLYTLQDTDVEKEVKLFEPSCIAHEEVPLIQNNAPSYYKNSFYSNSSFYFSTDMFKINKAVRQKRNKQMIKKKQNYLEQGALKSNQSYNRFLTHSIFEESSFKVRALKGDLMKKAALYGITIAWPDLPYLTELDKLALFEKTLNCNIEATCRESEKESKGELEQNKSEIKSNNEDNEMRDSNDTQCNEERKEDSVDFINKRSREKINALRILCQNNINHNQSSENILTISMLKTNAEALIKESISELSLSSWCSAVDLCAITQKSGWPRMSHIAAFFLLASIALGIISSEFYFLIV